MTQLIESGYFEKKKNIDLNFEQIFFCTIKIREKSSFS